MKGKILLFSSVLLVLAVLCIAYLGLGRRRFAG